MLKRLDTASSQCPAPWLTSEGHANRRAREISLSEARVYPPRVGGKYRHAALPESDGHTTNVAVVDNAGNAADITCTNNAACGSGVVAAGTGILLNNGLRNATPAPHPNQLEGNKFLSTTIAPTIVVKDGRPILVLGAGGSAAIPRAIAGVISDVVDFRMDIALAVDHERLHAYQDDMSGNQEVAIKEAPSVVVELEARVHRLFRFGEYACCTITAFVHAAGVDPATGNRVATVDPRQSDGAAIGHDP